MSKGVILDHFVRHRICFNCNTISKDELKIFLKKEPIIVHGKIHHKFCCERCFNLLTNILHKYKKRDFVYRLKEVIK